MGIIALHAIGLMAGGNAAPRNPCAGLAALTHGGPLVKLAATPARRQAGPSWRSWPSAGSDAVDPLGRGMKIWPSIHEPLTRRLANG